MFKPFLAFSLFLGCLLVLVLEPTTAFTVKLAGTSNTFGERHVEGLKKGKVPIGDDALPGFDERRNAGHNAPTSDELYLENLVAGKPMTNDEIDAYLTKFGYLVPPVNGSVSARERKDAIKEFQRFSHLDQSGFVDTHTKKKMQISRCGMTDPVSNNKFANFDAKGTRKWSKKDLTYKIVQFSKKLPENIVREWTEKSFKMWSDVSQLTFTEVSSDDADLRLKFTPRKHGDGFPFDGKGGVLAHAFYPQNGDIHLEEEEEWTIESSKGTNLLFVLVHEIGHALGLGHSEVDNAIMEPYYNGYIPNLALDKDDIAGIQFLYGKPITPPKPNPPTKAPVTKAPATNAPTTKAPATEAPATTAPTTKAPATVAPTTNAPATKAPATKAPVTKVPATEVPTTKAPTTSVFPTKAPVTKPQATDSPVTKVTATKAWPTTRPYITHLASKVPRTTYPATWAPSTTFAPTKYPFTDGPSTEDPFYPTPPPNRNFPCPFRFWATVTTGNRTFATFRSSIYEILPSGRFKRVGLIKRIFPRAPRVIGAAAYNEITGHTFLFWRQWVWRYTDHVLDRGFPKKLKNFIRAAVVVDGQLIAFSFTHIHYFDEDTMEDYVDGEVSISEEYPGLPYSIRAAVSYGDGVAHILYTRKIYKLDMYTGEMSIEKSCFRKWG